MQYDISDSWILLTIVNWNSFHLTFQSYNFSIQHDTSLEATPVGSISYSLIKCGQHSFPVCPDKYFSDNTTGLVQSNVLYSFVFGTVLCEKFSGATIV